MMLNGRELLWEERIRNNGREKGEGKERSRYDRIHCHSSRVRVGRAAGAVMHRPLDSGAASSAACRQGKKDIGRSWKKEKK